MRSGRPKAELVLSATERENLESMARRARSAPQLARRARIILKCAARVDNKTVARQLRVTPQMVGKWRARFVSERLAGCMTSRGRGRRARSPMRKWKT